MYHVTARGNERRAIGVSDVDAAFLEEARASRLCIGSADFRARVRTLYETLLDGKGRTEDVAFRRVGKQLPAERILRTVCAGLGVERAALRRRRRDSLDRAVASRMLCDYGGLTQRQVADILRLHSGAAVSAQLRKLTERLKSHRPLRKQVAGIVAELRNASC